MQKLQNLSSVQVIALFKKMVDFASFPGSQKIYIVE